MARYIWLLSFDTPDTLGFRGVGVHIHSCLRESYKAIYVGYRKQPMEEGWKQNRSS